MSILSSLKTSTVVAAIKERKLFKRDRNTVARERFVHNLQTQKQLIVGDMTGTKPVIKSLTNKELKNPRKWYFKDEKGKYWTKLVWQFEEIKIDGTNTDVEIGEMAKGPALYDTLIEAVKAGEFDTWLNKEPLPRGKKKIEMASSHIQDDGFAKVFPKK